MDRTDWAALAALIWLMVMALWIVPRATTVSCQRPTIANCH